MEPLSALAGSIQPPNSQLKWLSRIHSRAPPIKAIAPRPTPRKHSPPNHASRFHSSSLISRWHRRSDRTMDNRTKEITTEFLGSRQQLMSFIYGLIRDPQRAEDIFQETWLKLANALQQGVLIEQQAKWCRKVAKNLVLQHWRQQRNSKVIADSSLLEFLDFVELAYDENPVEKVTERQQAL